MVGFVVFLFSLLANWLTGNANAHSFQAAVLGLQYWYALWAIVFGVLFGFIMLYAIVCGGLIGALANGYFGWLIGTFGAGIVTIVVLGLIYVFGWLAPYFGTTLLVTNNAPYGYAMIIAGTLFNAWFFHSWVKNVQAGN